MEDPGLWKNLKSEWKRRKEDGKMISNDEIKKIIDDVKINHDLLKSCTLHNFSIDLNETKTLNKKWQCTKCKGKVDTLAKRWYEKGIEHCTNFKER